MKRRLCAAILFLQAIVLGLTTPVLISVKDVSVPAALSIGLGLLVACLLTAGLLRFRWAYWIGWAIQACSLALGALIAPMIVLGVVFSALWTTAYFMGAKIEREVGERAAATGPANGDQPGRR